MINESLIIKLLAGLVMTIFTAISTILWSMINTLKNSNKNAHHRISDQERYNSDTFARKDDVVRMETNILNALSRIDGKIERLHDVKENKK